MSDLVEIGVKVTTIGDDKELQSPPNPLEESEEYLEKQRYIIQERWKAMNAARKAKHADGNGRGH